MDLPGIPHAHSNILLFMRSCCVENDMFGSMHHTLPMDHTACYNAFMQHDARIILTLSYRKCHRTCCYITLSSQI